LILIPVLINYRTKKENSPPKKSRIENRIVKMKKRKGKEDEAPSLGQRAD